MEKISYVLQYFKGCFFYLMTKISICCSVNILDTGPLVKKDAQLMLSKEWSQFWHPSASWLPSPGTDITSTAQVSLHVLNVAPKKSSKLKLVIRGRINCASSFLQGRNCFGAHLWLWAPLFGYCQYSGRLFLFPAGVIMILNPWGPVALWTTPKETGKVDHSSNVSEPLCVGINQEKEHILNMQESLSRPFQHPVFHKRKRNRFKINHNKDFVFPMPCYPKFHRNYITYVTTITVLYLLFPVYTIISNYSAIYQYFKKIHHQKVNF